MSQAKMELTPENFRSMIYYDFRCGLSQQQSIERLVSAFGDEAPSRTTVYDWFAEFKRGRSSLNKSYGGGHPKTAITQENIDAVQKLIEEDRHVTYDEIRTSLGIGMSQIQKILHDELWVRKLISRWVPHNLSEEQKKARVDWCRTNLERFNGGSSNLVYNIVSGDETWIYSYEPDSKTQSTVWSFVNELKPTKVTRSRSVSKKMVASFVSKSGHVATICLEDRKTVNADWYTTICLPEVIAELRKSNSNRRIILHHDNASSHTARRTIEFLAENKIDLMDHPPYSPDLSPNDFFTFPRIKEKLRGQRFQSPEEAVEAYKTLVLTTPTSDWNNCFNNWFERMEKCIKFNGIYFEKQ